MIPALLQTLKQWPPEPKTGRPSPGELQRAGGLTWSLGWPLRRETGDVVDILLPMEPKLEAGSKTISTGGRGNTHNQNRNNWVVGGLPYATVSMGPLLFALPLEAPGSEWQYALLRGQKLRLTRRPMPGRWDWPLRAPLTVTAQAKKIVWDDVWTLPPASALEAAARDTAAAAVSVELVPYGCSQLFKVSMFPFV